jgi:hypothetical protein
MRTHTATLRLGCQSADDLQLPLRLGSGCCACRGQQRLLQLFGLNCPGPQCNNGGGLEFPLSISGEPDDALARWRIPASRTWLALSAQCSGNAVT